MRSWLGARKARFASAYRHIYRQEPPTCASRRYGLTIRQSPIFARSRRLLPCKFVAEQAFSQLPHLPAKRQFVFCSRAANWVQALALNFSNSSRRGTKRSSAPIHDIVFQSYGYATFSGGNGITGPRVPLASKLL